MGRLTQIWVLNCFDYSDDPEGYCMYFFSSLMSHSCCPNAFWYDDGEDHVMRARCDIEIGDEICISYLSEAYLMRSAPERRWDLFETKHFWCACPRCVEGPDLSRGFVCPSCEGHGVFGPTPAIGPAVWEKDPPPDDLEGIACFLCGHIVTKPDAELLARFEASIAQLAITFPEEEIDSTQAGWFEANLPAVLGQHWLADLAWEHIVESRWTEAPRGEECLRLLRQRCAFHAEAYPGLNACHAWALETLADALSETDEPDANVEAARAYAEAHRILSLLYGEKHPEVLSIASKQRLLQPERETPQAKRRRLRRKTPPPLDRFQQS